MAEIGKSIHFERLLHDDEKLEYFTNEQDCEHWFNIINEELFDGELPLVPFTFKWLRKYWAFYEYYPRTPNKLEMIVMHKRYPSKRVFVECLAHEMIHHWQYKKLGWRKVDHNDEFFVWCKKANDIGLRVDKEQGE